ncbi:Predicted membrane protein [uncultured Roseburia sp.]|uniref:YhdT family protein n=1 Tax=Brotonthovivens ammoniilytica TaxID=2981725 RepID=A0ABT2TMI7_9FIRM|nr:YhdT family protein [Brotonthovivens ammoniilytica]MCU6762842.1 YhdT family protein [Brotonthovivens ammoniilytica]SCI90916.1 Predicted membrane protein [uncultured Roseburia sp.]
MNKKKIFEQIKKEAKATFFVLVLLIVVWCVLGFGVSRLDITFFHTPLWAITGCLGTWIFSILAVWWLIKRIYKNFDLTEEEEKDE